MAQVATIEQQREIMRYMTGLNDWLGRDVHDRQEEIRAVTSRIDQLRDMLMEVMARTAQGECITSISYHSLTIPQRLLTQ
jgi:hypothetical protein